MYAWYCFFSELFALVLFLIYVLFEAGWLCPLTLLFQQILTALISLVTSKLKLCLFLSAGEHCMCCPSQAGIFGCMIFSCDLDFINAADSFRFSICSHLFSYHH